MGDPYAEFGGQQQSTPPPGQSASDPYAEFGGQAQQQPGKYQGMIDEIRSIYTPQNAVKALPLAMGGGLQTVGEEAPGVVSSLLNRVRGAVGLKPQAPAPTTSPQTGAAEATPVPIGKFTKEVPNPDPYKFSGAPKSMDIAQSTNVGKVGYNPDAKVMTVEYKNGMVYSYHGVPQEIYNGAKDSESVGSYISRNVKGRYETVRRGSVLVKKSR